MSRPLPVWPACPNLDGRICRVASDVAGVDVRPFGSDCTGKCAMYGGPYMGRQCADVGAWVDRMVFADVMRARRARRTVIPAPQVAPGATTPPKVADVSSVARTCGKCSREQQRRAV